LIAGAPLRSRAAALREQPGQAASMMLTVAAAVLAAAVVLFAFGDTALITFEFL
jgi:hypothetical protein